MSTVGCLIGVNGELLTLKLNPSLVGVTLRSLSEGGYRSEEMYLSPDSYHRCECVYEDLGNIPVNCLLDM